MRIDCAILLFTLIAPLQIGAQSMERAAVETVSLSLALHRVAALDFGAAAPLRLPLCLQDEHIGKLERVLAPGETGQTEPMKPATAEERAALPVQLSAENKVFSGQTFLAKGKALKLMLVEPAQGTPYLFADVNMNGAFEGGERFEFTVPHGRTLIADPQVTLQVEYAIGSFSVYPIRIILPQEPLYKDQVDNPGGRYLLRSPLEFVQGSVEIGGKPVRTLFMFNPSKAGAWADYGWQGMDTNGDGWINQGSNSEEFTFVRDESVLFHVNGHDVSTASIDLEAGTFVVREHPPGDNTRIPLRVGDTLPDFSYTDIDNKSHHLSEFRGSYVLLDFWGTWCAPCRAELPNLEKAWQRFRTRGLVILGIDDDEEVEQARKLLEEKHVTFFQALAPSGRELVKKRFRVSMFPTLALLDPEGKLILLDENLLRGDGLAATLEGLLPPAK